MSHAIRRPDTAFSVAPIGKQKKRQREKNDAHLDFIRSLPCLVTGQWNVEAAHVRYGDPRYGKPETGMGEKPHDKWSVPLSNEAHRRQHSMNERDYWIEVGIDPLQIALLLYAHTGDDDVCKQIIRSAKP